MAQFPTTTYRIQFTKDFTFLDLEMLVPYFTRLGIGAIYASPIFRAVPGSNHGYDQTDPTQLNPEIGSLGQLKRTAAKLADAGIGWIQDIVPNHMAFHPENPWLRDLLEKGPNSHHRKVFDTPFASSDFFSGPLMLPFLELPLKEAIHAGQLVVQSVGQQFRLAFGGKVWPINRAGQEFLRAQQEQGKPLNQPTIIHDLIALQYYEPCSWKDTNHRINYRRFFTVNDLIALNVQHRDVFDATHKLIARLVEDGVFTGVRVDHVDGLSDPAGYLLRLRRLVGESVFIIVEKILQPNERLPSQWPVQGTSGYDFLGMANAVLANGNNEARLTRFYAKVAGQKETVAPLLLQAKESQLMGAMQGELNNLSRFLYEVVFASTMSSDSIDRQALKSALAQFIIHCPVYRWYGHAFPLTDAEGNAVKKTLETAAVNHPHLRKELALLEALFAPAVSAETERPIGQLASFYQRCMQLTGALMAKGLEDTLMYTYNRYIGANEVGGSPAEFSRSVAGFHEFMEARRLFHPNTLNATATHDTKRGEDMSAWLQVITAFPEDWMAAVKLWIRWNAPLKMEGTPDENDEYFIYQTVWGTFPLVSGPLKPYRERLEAYLVKAMREAKRYTDWTAPNLKYEKSVVRFIRQMLRPGTSFLKHFSVFRAGFLDLAVLNALSKVVLKFTCPGIPDCYQGNESWDLSFVDPDNRRPVDFATRLRWQEKLHKTSAKTLALKESWSERYSGRLKYTITEQLAQLRRRHPDLFEKGLYLPVEVSGRYRRKVLSFIRRIPNKWLLVVVPLHIDRRMIAKNGELAHIDWESTRITLPDDAPRQWCHVFTDEVSTFTNRVVLDPHFHPLPIGVWEAVDEMPQANRAAGILMPLFSLPGPYGIGDLGGGAYQFVDFLRQARQRYWLMLPQQPTDSSVAYSPYSSQSAVAGNTLLVDLESFVRQGWLNRADLKMGESISSSKVDYDNAVALKNVLLGKAFRNYRRQWEGRQDGRFDGFCEREAAWLDDYALYAALKEFHHGKPWYAWPPAYRDRDPKTLGEFTSAHPYALQKTRWLQYQFAEQWADLRRYALQSGVRFIGDIPFYLNHDAADVWAQRQLFKLDGNGRPMAMAGVPPDYFNADGQLWGMPVYRWETHVSSAFAWWRQRIIKNLECYDLLRLDHFRAFCDYWEISRTAESAKDGSWQPGPGKALFDALGKSIGGLPFIAEDLGDIHDGVYRLRDELGIPGMKVLQFAFGDDIATNFHAPHNHTARDVVFTGTHDNNTAAGWYSDELSASDRARLKAYIGAGTLTPKRAALALIRLAYVSPAEMAITPLQDVLTLGAEARMNIPAEPAGNWRWRLNPDQLAPRLRRRLSEWVQLYGR